MTEVELARRAGLATDRIVFDSPVKTTSEIRRLAADYAGLRVNADSLAELARYPADGSRLKLGLRINPLISGETIHSMNVGGPYSKFGEPVSRRDDIIDACRRHPDLDCLHVHIGSQIRDYKPTARAIAGLADLADQINHVCRKPKIKTLDIGGGFPVNYRNGPPHPEIADYVDAIREACPRIFEGAFQIITEFGRYVHANSGWAVSTIEYIKPTPDGFNLLTHLGADMFVRECYNPGEWYHQMFVMDPAGNEKNDCPPVRSRIAGPLCFGGDFIGEPVPLGLADPGDKLVIQDVGANTFSLWSRHCSRPFPKVIALSNDGRKMKIIKHRESIDSLASFWS